MRDSLRSFVSAIIVVVMVFLLIALPYAVIEAFGLEAEKLVLLMNLAVLAVFSLAFSIQWLVKYKQTGPRFEETLERKGGVNVSADESGVNGIFLEFERELLSTPATDYYYPCRGSGGASPKEANK